MQSHYNTQTKRDHITLSSRIENNKLNFNKISGIMRIIFNDQVTKKNLLSFITPIIIKNDLKVERLMRRHKKMILCWICENMHLFPNLTELVKEKWPVECL